VCLSSATDVGIPATGKAVAMAGISVYWIAEGRMLAAWVQYDMAGLLRQLEELPWPGQ
jgi:predicted ester cyclase